MNTKLTGITKEREIMFCIAPFESKDEMGGACGALRGGEGCIQHFGWEA
jgi:hypothetical protein